MTPDPLLIFSIGHGWAMEFFKPLHKPQDDRNETESKDNRPEHAMENDNPKHEKTGENIEPLSGTERRLFKVVQAHLIGYLIWGSHY